MYRKSLGPADSEARSVCGVWGRPCGVSLTGGGNCTMNEDKRIVPIMMSSLDLIGN